MDETFILPDVPGAEPEEPQSSRTYRLDFETGHIVGFVDGLVAINQAIKKSVRTPRFECAIYGTEYGSEMYTLDRDDHNLLTEDLPRIIEEALSTDNRVLSVENTEIDFADDKAEILSRVQTVFGETELLEVIEDV